MMRFIWGMAWGIGLSLLALLAICRTTHVNICWTVSERHIEMLGHRADFDRQDSQPLPTVYIGSAKWAGK